MQKIHYSDCAVHNGPAYEPGRCDCGGLELAEDGSRGDKLARMRCRFLDASTELLAKAHWLGQLRARGREAGRDYLVRASEPIRFIERYQRQYQ